MSLKNLDFLFYTYQNFISAVYLLMVCIKLDHCLHHDKVVMLVFWDEILCYGVKSFSHFDTL